jgi:hypothetical protein
MDLSGEHETDRTYKCSPALKVILSRSAVGKKIPVITVAPSSANNSTEAEVLAPGAC